LFRVTLKESRALASNPESETESKKIGSPI